MIKRQFFKNLFPLPAIVFLVLPLVITSLVLGLSLIGATKGLENAFYDASLRLGPQIKQDERVVFLNIDDSSLEYLGSFPWRRSELARYLLEAHRFGPAVIGLDINYDLPSAHRVPDFVAKAIVARQEGLAADEMMEVISQSEDPIFGNLLRSMDNIVAASLVNGFAEIPKNQMDPAKNRISYLAQEIGFLEEDTGYSTISKDDDGLVRRFKPALTDGQLIPSFALKMYLKANPGAKVELDEQLLTIRSDKENSLSYTLDDKANLPLLFPKTSYFNSFKQLSFAQVIALVKLEESLWQNISLLEEFGLLDPRALGAEALSFRKRSQELLLDLALRGLPNSSQEFYRLKNVSDELLEGFLFEKGEAQVKQFLLDSNNTTVTSEDIDFLFEESRKQFLDLKAIKAELAVALKGAYLTVGYSATATTDIVAQPFDSKYLGAGIHGSFLNMLLTNQKIVKPAEPLSWLLALLLSITIAFIVRKLNASKGLLVSTLFLLIVVGAGFASFVFFTIMLDLAVIVLASGVTALIMLGLEYVGTEGERQWLYGAFSRYISQEFIDQLVSQPDKLQLGGEERELTMLFTDIKDFSGLAQSFSPQELVKLLNTYLEFMSGIILDHGGTIDKYEGDAIICFFGAPVHFDDHAQRAIKAAVALNEGSKELNRRLMEDFKLSHPIETRIGINTGKVLVGNLGTERRMDYTVMGHAVNIASRVEGANKLFASSILATIDSLQKPDETVVTRKLGPISLIGIHEPVELVEVRGNVSQLSVAIVEASQLLSQAVERIKAGQPSDAQKLLEAALVREPNDLVIVQYLKRIELFTSGRLSSFFPLTMQEK